MFVSTSPSMAAAVGYYRWANDGGSKGITACDDDDEVVKAKKGDRYGLHLQAA